MVPLFINVKNDKQFFIPLEYRVNIGRFTTRNTDVVDKNILCLQRLQFIVLIIIVFKICWGS